MLDARFSHLYFYQSLNRLQRGLSATAELLVNNNNNNDYSNADVMSAPFGVAATF